MKIHSYPLLAMLAFVLFAACSATPEVYDLKCEGLTEPLGIDSDMPHFSWKTRCDKTMTQVAYQIEVASSADKLLAGEADLWQSGQVASAEQVMVPYSGAPSHHGSNAGGGSGCGTTTAHRHGAVRSGSASESSTKSKDDTSVPLRAIPPL